MEANNMAAMRETLEATRSFVVNLEIEPYSPLDEAASGLLAKIDAALSAPPRNCDLYDGDLKMLRMAWHDWTNSPSGLNPDGTAKLTFSEWLLKKAVSMTSKDSLEDIAADLREDARQIRRSREIALRMTPQPTLRGHFLDEIFEAYAQRIDAAAES